VTKVIVAGPLQCQRNIVQLGEQRCDRRLQQPLGFCVVGKDGRLDVQLNLRFPSTLHPTLLCPLVFTILRLGSAGIFHMDIRTYAP
jgi:hypothetical protein